MLTTRQTIGLATCAILTIGGLSLAAQGRGQGNGQGPPPSQLFGTYELQSTRGGNPQRTADAATRSLPSAQRNRAYQNLLARLEAPEVLSIEHRGRSVTIESSSGPRSAFDADGRMQSERGPDGRTVSTRAEVIGNQLRVSTSGGGRSSDYMVTFAPLNNGAGMVVTRRVDDDNLARPVTMQSYYQRTSAVARWDVYGSGPGYGRGRGMGNNNGNNSDSNNRNSNNRNSNGSSNGNNNGNGNGPDSNYGYGGSSGRVLVPYGTQIFATLDTPLSMRTSRQGEPFTMTVRSPTQFQGARIDGIVSRVDVDRGSDNGRDMRLDFQRIDVRGRSSDFSAMLDSVQLADGTLLRVNDEGGMQGADHGNNTVRNGAIGAAVGAIIGAVAGGGKGAAIGAVVGGAGGAILSQGHEQLDLPRGADVVLTSTTGN